MSIAYWCIFIAAILPYIWITVGKSAKGYDNRDPRGWVAKQAQPRVQRSNAAHLNAFEAFAPFAAGVLMAQAAGVDAERITMLAVSFIIARILHGAFYIADKHVLRSLSWFAGIGCVATLMIQAAMRAV
jgi:uncharacterized MAPEG superfamily protein